MQTEYDQELSPEVKEKMKKNLVYIGSFSIIMLFAGFASAYIVSKGDTFWLKVPMPIEFWISTAIIGLSSLTYIKALKVIQAGSKSALKLWMAITFVLGLLFVVFQFRGYNALIDKGANPINNHIMVTDGRYGDYYEIEMNGSPITVSGNNYSIEGNELTDEQWSQLKEFMQQFIGVDLESELAVSNYGEVFTLKFNKEPMASINGVLKKNDGTAMENVDRSRLYHLAMNVVDGRGDFFVKGKLGEDFDIYYKGEALTYENRTLYYEGKKLSNYLQLKVTETADTATTFLYLITVIHLLHILVAMIYLSKLTIKSFKGAFTHADHLSIKLGGLFWHFLGLLWLVLLLFLLFYH